MRYSLSVLTAACLLALGQPAWSKIQDSHWQQRVQTAVLALPAMDRRGGALLLQELQALQDTRHARTRTLTLAALTNASQTLAQLHYQTHLQHLLLAPAFVPQHWIKPVPQDLHAQSLMRLDESMLKRRTQALMLHFAGDLS